MKLIKTATLIAGMAALSLCSYAQRIKILEGDLAPLKNEKTINTEFTYDHMSVGKFDNEADYIAKKTEEYNKKESGKGDRWAKDWVADRHSQFEPKFNELFERESDLTVKKDSKYTLIYKTKTTEPGFNIYITRKNAETDAEAWIVETANPSKVVAKISVENAKGRTFGGNDYDTGARLAECYAVGGKYLGKFMKKEWK